MFLRCQIGLGKILHVNKKVHCFSTLPSAICLCVSSCSQINQVGDQESKGIGTTAVVSFPLPHFLPPSKNILNITHIEVLYNARKK